MVRERWCDFDHLQVCSRRWPPLTVNVGSERSVNHLFRSLADVLGLSRGLQVERLEATCWDAVPDGGCVRLEDYRLVHIN